MAMRRRLRSGRVAAPRRVILCVSRDERRARVRRRRARVPRTHGRELRATSGTVTSLLLWPGGGGVSLARPPRGAPGHADGGGARAIVLLLLLLL